MPRSWSIAQTVVAGVMAVGLAFAAVALAGSQRSGQRDLEQRFEERARIAAALIEGTVAETLGGSARGLLPVLTGRTIDAAALERTRRGQSANAIVVFDAAGNVLATAPPLPARRLRRAAVANAPEVRRALGGTPAISPVRSSPVDGRSVIAVALPQVTTYGRRVVDIAYPIALIGPFLGTYVAKVPDVEGGSAYVVDPAGRVIGTSRSGSRLGGALPDATLAAALEREHRGHYERDGERYFYAADGIERTPWRVVVVAPEAELYAPVGGLGPLLSWVILAGLAISIAVVLLLVRRAVNDARELDRANRELAQRNREIQEANRMKSEFLANMSHELRTPLNSVIGFAELMVDGRLGEVPPAHREALEDILTSSHHLLELINGVLDLAKVEAGALEISPEPVALGPLVAEMRDVLRELAARKRITIADEVDPRVGEVVTDAARVKQILYNYLSNALKFTPDGGHVTIRVRPAGADAFRLEVEDDGIGIREEDVPRLFEQFEQLDAGRAKLHQGTGLGLALTKRLAEALGGSVGVRSTFGRGSVFHVVLPRVTTPSEDVAGNGRPGTGRDRDEAATREAGT